MHDCPTCGIPLHGHEEKCPSCGARQLVRRDMRSFSNLPKEPGVNMMPIVIAFIILAFGLFCIAQSTWVGQLMRQGPPKENPMDKMTFMDARNLIQTQINQNLATCGAKGTLTWKKMDETPTDINLPDSVQLAVETSLKSPDQRKDIIDPIKDYMEKAKVPTLTLSDRRSHATWTYNVSAPVPAPADTTDGAQTQ